MKIENELRPSTGYHPPPYRLDWAPTSHHTTLLRPESINPTDTSRDSWSSTRNCTTNSGSVDGPSWKGFLQRQKLSRLPNWRHRCRRWSSRWMTALRPTSLRAAKSLHASFHRPRRCGRVQRLFALHRWLSPRAHTRAIPVPGEPHNKIPPAELIDLKREVLACAPKGAVVCHHSQTLHTSHRNESDRWRRGFATHWAGLDVTSTDVAINNAYYNIYPELYAETLAALGA